MSDACVSERPQSKAPGKVWRLELPVEVRHQRSVAERRQSAQHFADGFAGFIRTQLGGPVAYRSLGERLPIVDIMIGWVCALQGK